MSAGAAPGGSIELPGPFTLERALLIENDSGHEEASWVT